MAWGRVYSTPTLDGRPLGKQLERNCFSTKNVFNPESPWGGKMAQLLKVLVTQHEGRSSIPS